MKETEGHPDIGATRGTGGDQEGATPGSITRRTYLRQSLMGGAALAGTAFFDSLTTMNVAMAQGNSFSFAWVSDTHLYPKTLNTRFVEKAARAFKDVSAMGNQLDFMIFGGDLAQLGDPVEIALGADLLKEVKIKKYFIPGEHDWYLDMGNAWEKTFGDRPGSSTTRAFASSA